MRFLFVDQILNKESGRKISGVKHITPDDSFLCKSTVIDSFYFIPSLIGETIGQLAAWLVMEEIDFTLRPVAGVVAEARMMQPAYVGQTLFLECEIDALDDIAVEYHGQASVNGQVVFTVNGAIGPMLPMEQFIDKELVKQQFIEIYRPSAEDISTYYSPPIMRHSCQEYFMQFDQVTEVKQQHSCKALKKISRSGLYFQDHFPNKPVLPLTMLLECKRRLAEEFLDCSGWQDKYTLVSMEKIKMSDFVQPGDIIQTELIVKRENAQELVLHLRTFLANKRVCVVDLVYQAEV